MKKIIAWLKDKKDWLWTFNSPPTVILNSEEIKIRLGRYTEWLNVKGRVTVIVNYDDFELISKDAQNTHKFNEWKKII